MKISELKNLVNESLRDWFKKEKWVRISSSGDIAGPCGTSKNKKNPDRCLPKAKAQSLSKSERAATARKKKKAGSSGKQFVSNTKKAKVTREAVLEIIREVISEKKNKKKDDRCTRIAKRKYDSWPCVPLHSEALTKTGWKKYGELSVGDEILSFDIESGTLKYTPIEYLHFYENADIVKFTKQNYEIESTPNHKWLTYSSHERNPDSQNLGYKKSIEIFESIRDYESKGIINENLENFKRYVYPTYKDMTIWDIFDKLKAPKGSLRFKTTEEIKSSDLIKSSAPLDLGYSGVDIMPFRKYNSTNNIEKVLNFSREQAESYVYSAIMYDGWDTTNDTRVRDSATCNKFALKQKDETHSDMFEIAAIYSGFNVTRGSDSYGMRTYYIKDNDYISCDVLKKNQGESQDVWCPTTKYGTWLMRQNGRVMITGNSAYASGAVVRCRRGEIWKKEN